MRHLAIGLCFLLGACCWKNTCDTKEYTVIRETSRPVSVKSEVVQQQAMPVAAAPQIMIPNNQTMYYSVQSQPVVYYQNVPVMEAMPVQQQFVMQEPAMAVQQRQVQSPYVPEAYRASVSNGVQATQDVAHCIIVLQHPQARDLVRCLNTDFTCISSYEKLGYVQLRHTPQFSGAADQEVASDYPVRSQRVNNNIPRW